MKITSSKRDKIDEEEKVTAESKTAKIDRSAATDKIKEAIDELAKIDDDKASEDAIANLSVILLDLQ